jgi:alkylation response protein AidB-like acyl-CoA dehydrogenase
MAKLFASEPAEKVCSDAIHDPRRLRLRVGFPGRADLARRAGYTIYEGASDIQRLVIGRALAT